MSRSLPGGLGVSITSNSGGLSGPATLNPNSATGYQLSFAIGLTRVLAGFGAVAQNTIRQIPLGSFVDGVAGGLTIPGVDAGLYLLQRGCK